MASNLEFIEKRTASNVVNVTHTNLFSTKYNIYELYLDMQYNASSYFDINLLDSNGDVLTDSNYDVSIYEMKNWTTENQYKYQNSTIWRDFTGYLENYDIGGAMRMTVFNPTNSTYTLANTVGVTKVSSGLFGVIGQGIYTNTAGVYGMKFSASGGGTTTFDFLNVSVYGVKE